MFGFTVVGLKNDLVGEVRSNFAHRSITLERPRHSFVRGGEVVVYRA
jgi:hypothetical protein